MGVVGVYRLIFSRLSRQHLPLPASGDSAGTADPASVASSVAGGLHSLGILAYQTVTDGRLLAALGPSHIAFPKV